MANDGMVCTKCGTDKEPRKNGMYATGRLKGTQRTKCKVCGFEGKRKLTVSQYEPKLSYKVEDVESRFLEVANLKGDLTRYPLTEETHLQVVTDKSKSNEFGEVFTPLWLVDKMLDKTDNGWDNNEHTTLDMCAGYGQFTVRMIRKKYSVMGTKFNLEQFLTETHSFNELQVESCFKLLHIFGHDINLYIGDSRKLTELEEDDAKIMYHFEKYGWVDITTKTRKLFYKHTLDTIDDFTKQFNMMVSKEELRVKKYEELNQAFIEKKKREEIAKQKKANEVKANGEQMPFLIFGDD